MFNICKVRHTLLQTKTCLHLHGTVASDAVTAAATLHFTTNAVVGWLKFHLLTLLFFFSLFCIALLNCPRHRHRFNFFLFLLLHRGRVLKRLQPPCQCSPWAVRLPNNWQYYSSNTVAQAKRRNCWKAVTAEAENVFAKANESCAVSCLRSCCR